MPPRKKSDRKPIEQYEHTGQERLNNPPVGLVTGARPEQPISRREVEEVVASLRSMIDGMARMLDAERVAGRENGR
jgi:hypothetical protein